jgi:hypothetical protein
MTSTGCIGPTPQIEDCRFSALMADAASFTCAFAGFSPIWRMGFCHLRGESETRPVVQTRGHARWRRVGSVSLKLA